MSKITKKLGEYAKKKRINILLKRASYHEQKSKYYTVLINHIDKDINDVSAYGTITNKDKIMKDRQIFVKKMTLHNVKAFAFNNVANMYME